MARISLGALALFFTLALAGGGAVGASDDPLSNVRSVKLTMPDPGEAAAACGVGREALQAAFFKPLAQRGIAAVESGTGYRLFLRATTIGYLEKTCASI